MRYEAQSVQLQEIDSSDATFRLGFKDLPEYLVQSIQDHGLINPPILRRRSDGRYVIICGFRRVWAVEALAWSRLSVRVVMEAVSEMDLLKLAVSDNRSHRDLNVVEQAQGIRKLTAMGAPAELNILASWLGFPANQKVLDKITALAILPVSVQKGVLEEALSFEAAVDLSAFSDAEATAIFELLAGLKLSQNKEKEVIAMIREIAGRENTTISHLLEDRGIKRISFEKDVNRGEKAKQLRQYLKERRFPHLVKAKERFRRRMKVLKLPACCRMSPPTNFEGPLFSLSMVFKDVDQLTQCHRDLKPILEGPGMKRLLESHLETE